MEDFFHRHKSAGHPNHLARKMARIQLLHELERLLKNQGSSLEQFTLPQPEEDDMNIMNIQTSDVDPNAKSFFNINATKTNEE